MTNIEPVILYEDDDVVAIDKPAGLVVHADGVTTEATVVDWLLARCPVARGVGEQGYSQKGELLERSGVVHRLDRDTSGVLILAKHQEAFRHLKAQFHDRLVKKEYRAFVYGAMREQWGTIDRSIGRSTQDFRKRSAMRGAKGMLREAVTRYECIDSGKIDGEYFSYLTLIPKTGRTHQLRVHLRAIERPIVQDKLYAKHLLEQSSNLGLPRMALHAYLLELTLPSGAEKKLIAPVPLSFEVAADRIAKAS